MPVVIAQPLLQVDRQRVVDHRRFGNDVNRATRSVLAIQSALRSAQHFQTLYIKETHAVGIYRAHIRFVAIHPNRTGLAGAVIRHTYAANGEDRLHIAIGAADLHIGDLRRNIIGAGQAELLELGAGHTGDCDRGILGAFRAFLRRYNHFFQHGRR